jgi:uncharacterized protein
MTTSPPSASITPLPAAERVQALDVLRGVALLGILVMNIQGFAMIYAAYFNPMAYGDLSGVNGWVWKLSHLLTDQKFLSMFSMMFGAGIVLMSERIEAQGGKAASRHYRRILGLFVIGLAHAYLLWHGDILVVYSLCGLVVYLFRKRTPKTLLTLGVLAMVIPSAFYIFAGSSLPYWPEESYQPMLDLWAPRAELVQNEIAAYQSGWLAQMEHRVPSALFFQTGVFIMWGGWRAGGLMLVGMALFKWGVLTGERSKRFYGTMSALGLAVGLPAVAYGIVRNFAAGWALEYSFFLGSQFNYWAAPLVSLGYIGIVMLICKADRVERWTRPFAAVGRTAFSNYLLQTLICTTIFYGHGFGLFGQLERIGQILVVLGVWLVQLIVSSIWVRHFRYGPVEWLWRSATYLELQPMRLT